jgi:flagellar secretion chaperone FliS
MTPLHNPWASYKKVATQTATPAQLVIMLYDGALRFLNCALAGFNAEDPIEFNQAINNNILRAQAIIQELNNSLDMAAGGEFSSRMRALYHYLDRRLQESNLRKERFGLEEAVKHLTLLRDAWADVVQKGAHLAPVATPVHSAPATSS